MRSGPTPPTKKALTADAYRDLDELRELRPELDQRIAAAIPATGRGRPRRPSGRAVWRGVLVRCCRAEGLPDAVIAAEIALGDKHPKPYAIETLRQWELDVQQVERAEGVVTPDNPRDPQALRRVREALEAYGRRNPTEELALRREVELALADAGGPAPNAITAAIATAADRQAEWEAELLSVIADQDRERGDWVRPDPRTISLDAARTSDGHSLHDVIAES